MDLKTCNAQRKSLAHVSYSCSFVWLELHKNQCIFLCVHVLQTKRFRQSPSPSPESQQREITSKVHTCIKDIKKNGWYLCYGANKRSTSQPCVNKIRAFVYTKLNRECGCISESSQGEKKSAHLQVQLDGIHGGASTLCVFVYRNERVIL